MAQINLLSTSREGATQRREEREFSRLPLLTETPMLTMY